MNKTGIFPLGQAGARGAHGRMPPWVIRVQCSQNPSLRRPCKSVGLSGIKQMAGDSRWQCGKAQGGEGLRTFQGQRDFRQSLRENWGSVTTLSWGCGGLDHRRGPLPEVGLSFNPGPRESPLRQVGEGMAHLWGRPRAPVGRHGPNIGGGGLLGGWATLHV